MATRFGGAPARSYAARLYWLIGGLCAFIFVLVATIFAIATDRPVTDYSGSSTGAIAPTSEAPVSPTVKILQARQRIEATSQLTPGMFIDQAVLPERIPEGAVLARDKPTIAGKYAKSMIQANMPLLASDITDVKPLGGVVTSVIPPGYRAVTINVDARSSVEGWAAPNKRVDVLWTYQDKDSRRQIVTTIVRFSKILSVGGHTGRQQEEQGEQKKRKATTITLLVEELDASKIELARQTGTLSLALVGDKDPGKVSAQPRSVTIDDLMPRAKPEPTSEPSADGVMYSTDAKTGKQVKYLLINGRWKREAR